MANLGIHPDIAGFQDLAHAFDLKSAVVAARATLEAALERRPAARTTDRITPSSIRRFRSTWSGPVRAASSERRSRPYRTRSPP